MEPRISLAQLRQNLALLIDNVRRGKVHSLGDRVETVAEAAPHREQRWRSGVEANVVLASLGSDPVWAAELEELRTEVVMRDPWGEAE